jgi:2,3-bisphosphoglycerate-independent phosphoglycerate mutase
MTPDDRLPIVLVILDGLGDRACDVLGGRTPTEAARTPTLDALAARGANGVHIPFGRGVATSSEVSHWSMFGFEDVPFPGRAVLEAWGVGVEPPPHVPLFHLALRSGHPDGTAVRVSGRGGAGDAAEAAILFDALRGRKYEGITFGLEPIRASECLLVAAGAGSHEVSDSDPIFEHIHPWMQPLPLAEAADVAEAARTAGALQRWLRDSRSILCAHPVNRARVGRGLQALDLPVTKWPSLFDDRLLSFEQQVGVRGGAVTSSALYRGLARALRMTHVDQATGVLPPDEDIAARLVLAEKMLAEADFVHVHVKAPDEAGHRKDPHAKRHVVERLDTGLEALLGLADRVVVAVTGDHATPSVGSTLHTGDPTPLLVAGPGVRADSVQVFGETSSQAGTLGGMRARELMPLLTGSANRPFFRGHRPGPHRSIALPHAPTPMQT